MPSSIDEFLGLKGAVEILCEIEPDGTHFTELDEWIPASHDTIDNRLDEGEKLGLFEREPVAGQPGSSHKWVLSPVGARMQQELERRGAIEAYRVYRDATHRFEEKEDEFKAWVKENPEQLENHEFNRMVRFTRRFLTSDTDEIPYDPPFGRFFREYEWPSDDDSEE